MDENNRPVRKDSRRKRMTRLLAIILAALMILPLVVTGVIYLVQIF